MRLGAVLTPPPDPTGVPPSVVSQAVLGAPAAVQRPIRVAVAGYGYWGPNFCRVLAASTDFELAAVVELDWQRADAAMRLHRVRRYLSVADAVTLGSVDAVVVATPVLTHYDIAEAFIAAGKHVLVAKPLAASVREAEGLAALADRAGVVLLVDHTFVYTAAVRKMRDLYQSGDLGGALYLDSVRANLGLFQHDTDVVWDLAAHDASIAAFVLDELPTHVQAVGADRSGTGHADIAYLTCWYDDGLIVHAHVSWLSPVKVRRILFGGTRRMVVYDDVEPDEKIRVYDRGADVTTREGAHRAMVAYRTGDCLVPRLDATEALEAEVAHFAECIRGSGRSAVAGPRQGIAVVRVLEAATRSMAADGARIPV